MLVLIVIILIIVWVVGWLYIILDFFTLGWFGGLFRRKPPEPPKPETPYYIDDEINAIYELIEVNSKTLEDLNILLSITMKHNDQLKIRKKIADIQLKNAKLENKVNKLLDKYGG